MLWKTVPLAYGPEPEGVQSNIEPAALLVDFICVPPGIDIILFQVQEILSH